MSEGVTVVKMLPESAPVEDPIVFFSSPLLWNNVQLWPSSLQLYSRDKLVSSYPVV